MNQVEFLFLVQQQTNTESIVVDKFYKEVFLSLCRQDFEKTNFEWLSKTFNETIEEYKSVKLPTPYESILHYPGLLKLLQELYSIVIELDLIREINPGFELPLIGTANLASLGAYAKTDYNTIIIDRGLLFFFSNMSRILTELIVFEEGSNWIIRPSLLTLEEIQKRILNSDDIKRDFIEILTSYVRFGTTIPYSRYLKFYNSQKSIFYNLIGFESWRFIIAHEMMHLLFTHRQSTPSAELEADMMATQLCAKCIEKFQVETQLYWIPVFVTTMLDIIMECNETRGFNHSTHPQNRGQYAHYILGQMKVGGHALGMSQVVRSILKLLWEASKSTIIRLANDERIKNDDQLRRVISSIELY